MLKWDLLYIAMAKILRELCFPFPHSQTEAKSVWLGCLYDNSSFGSASMTFFSTQKG